MERGSGWVGEKHSELRIYLIALLSSKKTHKDAETQVHTMCSQFCHITFPLHPNNTQLSLFPSLYNAQI